MNPSQLALGQRTIIIKHDLGGVKLFWVSFGSISKIPAYHTLFEGSTSLASPILGEVPETILSLMTPWNSSGASLVKISIVPPVPTVQGT